MNRPHRPAHDTDKSLPGTAPSPYDNDPVERPGPDPDSDGEPLEP